MTEEQEEDIIRLLTRGDEKAMSILFRRYHRLLGAYCMRYLVSRETLFKDIEVSCESFLDEVSGETAERQEQICTELYATVGQLPEQICRVITGIVFNGKSYKAVADEMNVLKYNAKYVKMTNYHT